MSHAQFHECGRCFFIGRARGASNNWPSWKPEVAENLETQSQNGQNVVKIIYSKLLDSFGGNPTSDKVEHPLSRLQALPTAMVVGCSDQWVL